MCRNIHTGIIHDAADDETVRTADDINGEVVCLQIINDLQHRLVKAFASCHSFIARHGLLFELLDIVVELFQCHSFECGSHCLAVINFQTFEFGLLFVDFNDFVGNLFFKIGCLIFVVRIFQNTVYEKRVVEVIGVCLAEERSVEIEHRNPVLHRDEFRAAFVCDLSHVADQLALERGSVCPEIHHGVSVDPDSPGLRRAGCGVRRSGCLTLTLGFDCRSCGPGARWLSLHFLSEGHQ